MAKYLNKPYTKKDKNDFIANANKTGLRIERTELGLIALEVHEKLVDGVVVDNTEDYIKGLRERDKENIAMLKMTALDFINECEKELGLTYTVFKNLMDLNPEVEKQLRYCNHVFRGNPLLDQMAAGLGITPEQLDEMFIKFCGYKRLVEK